MTTPQNRFFMALVVLAIAASGVLCWRIERSPAIRHNETGKILYTDLAGRKVWIKKDVQKIVLLRSKDIYLLAALLGDELPKRLVAWGPDLKLDDSEFCKRLLEKFPRLRDITVTGDVYGDGLNVEQLAQIDADLIIADKFMLDRGFHYTEKLDATGLPVVYLDGSADPLIAPQKGLLFLGQVLQKEKRANEIAGFINAQINPILARIATNAPAAPAVYLEAGLLGPQQYGQTYGFSGVEKNQTSWGAILEALKVRNIAQGRVVGMAPINPEALLKADPDVIVITGQNWSRFKNPGSMQLGFNVNAAEARQLLNGFIARPGWNLLAAVKNKNVHGIFHNTISPTIFSGVQALAKDCYPDLFRDVEPDKNLREFYDRFMPVALDGTWSCAIE